MGAEINISELESANEEVRHRIAHPEPVLMGPVADGVHEVFKHIFETEGSYAGESWAPLSPWTEIKKARMGYPDQILVAEGNLQRSLVDRNALGGYTEMRDPQTVAVGSDDEAGFFHQGGTRNMPARPIAPDADSIPAQDVDDWTELVANYILGGVF